MKSKKPDLTKNFEVKAYLFYYEWLSIHLPQSKNSMFMMVKTNGVNECPFKNKLQVAPLGGATCG